MKWTIALILLTVLMLAGVPMYAGGLLINGGFETGDFTGWTQGGNTGYTEVVSGPSEVFDSAQEGTYYTIMGPVGSDGILSQTFSDAAGAQYTISFWLAAAGDNPSDFSAFWNGTLLLGLGNPSTGDAWTQYVFTMSGTGSDTVSFSFRDDPAYIALDNVSVSSSAIPEPASLTLLAGGLLALAFRLRRRK